MQFKANPHWKRISQTAIVELWEAEPGILVVSPFEDEYDDADTAHSCMDLLARHLAQQRQAGVVIILQDAFARQTGAAQQVYFQADPAVFRGLALVIRAPVDRLFTRMDLIFSRSRLPRHIAPDLETALAWSRGRLRTC